MKKILIFILSVVILVYQTALFCRAYAIPSLSAESAILMDLDSGQTLARYNDDQTMGMASTTKIMTALTVVKLADISRVVSIPKEAVGTEGSSVYLYENERLTIEQLLYALLLSSANDAAVALAICVSGSTENFVREMNTIARDLGLESTHFTNPHGLYDENHYTTAYELAMITREALKNSTLKKIFATYKADIPRDDIPDSRLLINHNKLLKSYAGAIGVKTGFTKRTGRCLVSAAERNGLTLICVTLNAPDDWKDHTSLLDYGFENYERRIIANAGEFTYEMSVVGGAKDSVLLTNTLPLTLTVRKNDTETEFKILSQNHFLYAPISEGAVCASVTVSCNGDFSSSPLAVSTEIPPKPSKNLWEKIAHILKKE